MENLAGKHIKGYELKERIAAGGFGAVYRAQQATVGRVPFLYLVEIDDVKVPRA